jgi:hypothetical protein
MGHVRLRLLVVVSRNHRETERRWVSQTAIRNLSTKVAELLRSLFPRVSRIFPAIFLGLPAA